MKAARIHVFGAAGAGVTTLARALAECLGSRYLDADDYLWTPTEPPYQTKRPIVDRVARLRQDTEAVSWVLGGSLDAWGGTVIRRISLNKA